MSDGKDLQKYFMEQTNEQLSDIRTDVKAIHARFDDFEKFKTGIQLNAKWMAWIVSSVSAVITLSVSTGITIYLSSRERQALMDAARIEAKHLIEENAAKDHL